MAITTYTIPAEKIVHNTSVDFSSRSSIINPIHIVQYDNSLPVISVELKNNNKAYVLPTDIEVWIRWKKPDNTFVRKQALGCNSERNTVYFEITQQMVMQDGLFKPVIELIIPSDSSDPSVASSGYFSVLVDRNPIQNGDIESMTEYEDPYGNVCYTKTAIDDMIVKKADKATTLAGYGITDAHSKTETKFVTPMQFGAVADGVTDDRGAIQVAINFCVENGYNLVIPKGTYYVTNSLLISWADNFHIVNYGTIKFQSSGLGEIPSAEEIATYTGDKLTEYRKTYQKPCFHLKYCTNCTIDAGTIISDRDRFEPAPQDHTRASYLGSNIVGIQFTSCKNTKLTNLNAQNLAYAVIVSGYYSDRSNGISIDNLHITGTSQPVYVQNCDDLTINKMYIEEQSGLGRGDHFVYASSYNGTLTVNSAHLVYTTCEMGVAFNLRYAGSSAGTLAELKDPKDYNDEADLKTCRINNCIIENNYMVASAKAKTKVFIDNLNLINSGNAEKNLFLMAEYAELEVCNSSLDGGENSQLLAIAMPSSITANFKNCSINVYKGFSTVFNVESYANYNNKLLFDSCDITFSNGYFLYPSNYISIDIVISKCSLYRTYTAGGVYTLYADSSTINYSIENSKIDNAAISAALVFTRDYIPSAAQIKVFNNIIGNTNRLCYRNGPVLNAVTENGNFIYTISADGEIVGSTNVYNKAEIDNYINLLNGTKENSSAKVSTTDNIVDENENYPSIAYLQNYYRTKTETGNALANKADLVQSKNIFDFDTWAKGLQNLSKPVYNGTLDVVDFDEKSITYTSTASSSYTNGWINTPDVMKITVKPNTVYTVSWKFVGSLKTQIFLFFNGQNTDETRLSKISTTGSGYLTFTTLEDTSYITIRFDNLITSTVSFSEIMLEESDKKSLYLPYEVAEGVKELAQSTEIALVEIMAQIQEILNKAN